MAMQPSKSVSSASTVAPLAIGCTSCAVVTLPRGNRTIAGSPAAAQYAASDADVSPVDAHATARILRPSEAICFTWLTSTVMPRSLKDPVCELPHCLTHRSGTPISRPKRSAQNRLVPPSSIDTTWSSRTLGATHSFLPHTAEPYGQVVRL